jgi:gas vesicle protein
MTEYSLAVIKDETTNFIKDNIGAIAAGTAGLVIGGAVGAIAASAISNKKSTKRRKSSNKYSRKRNHSHKTKKRGRYTPHTAGKGKDTSHKRIRQTKNGQPYVIMANGRARFIKKSSARRSRKTSGGRY